MQIIGIDGSLTSTGVCIFSEPFHAHRTFTVESKPGPLPGVAGRIARYQFLAQDVATKLVTDPGYGGEMHVFLEGYSWGSPFRAIPLAECGALLRQSILQESDSLIEVSPSEVKKFATGKGRGDKAQVQAHVAKRWNLIFGTDDECDAFILARIGLAYHGLAGCDNEAQREVIERLKNPPAKKTKKRRTANA